MRVRVGETVTSACPQCGDVAPREAYDIGSGAELSCASCEWCWGANGQNLKPVNMSPFRLRGGLVIRLDVGDML